MYTYTAVTNTYNEVKKKLHHLSNLKFYVSGQNEKSFVPL